jgi:hypothetical protein
MKVSHHFLISFSSYFLLHFRLINDLAPATEIPAKALEAIKIEIANFRVRMESIEQQALKSVGSLLSKARELFIHMDEWIGAKYQTEMEQIKNVHLVLKSRVELEQRIPQNCVRF